MLFRASSLNSLPLLLKMKLSSALYNTSKKPPKLNFKKQSAIFAEIPRSALKYIKEEEQHEEVEDEEAEVETLLSADRNKKHAVWAYFSERGENIVCNIGDCLRRYKSPATTTTLMYHLEHGDPQHQAIFAEILKPGNRKKNEIFASNFASTSKEEEAVSLPQAEVSSCTSTPTNKRVISFNTKLAIIEAATCINKSQLARQFNLPKSTVKGILSNKDAILKAICQGKDSRKSRLKPANILD
uniref:HTH psq-type domain-containing protein n=1 Tax=Ditylenchus dipsaci TaxID=166011 RepID=A0A915EDR3_9BILA